MTETGTGKPAGRALTDHFDPKPFNCAIVKHGTPSPASTASSPGAAEAGLPVAAPATMPQARGRTTPAFVLCTAYGRQRTNAGAHRAAGACDAAARGGLDAAAGRARLLARARASKASGARPPAAAPPGRLRGWASAADLAQPLLGGGAGSRAERDGRGRLAGGGESWIGGVPLGIYRYAPETIDVTAPIRRRAKRRVQGPLLVDPDRGGQRRSRGDPGHLASPARCSTSRPGAAASRLERLPGAGAKNWTLLDLDRRSKRSSPAPAAIAGAGGCGGRSRLYRPGARLHPLALSSGASSTLVRAAGLPDSGDELQRRGLRARRLLAEPSASRSNSTSSRPTARAPPSSATASARRS